MRAILSVTAMLVLLLVAGTVAQPVDSPRIFLLAARQALNDGRTDAASAALEQAETRALTRSVPRSRPQQPSKQPLVAIIADAREALAAGDGTAALLKIDEALASPDLSEPPD